MFRSELGCPCICLSNGRLAGGLEMAQASAQQKMQVPLLARTTRGFLLPSLRTSLSDRQTAVMKKKREFVALMLPTTCSPYRYSSYFALSRWERFLGFLICCSGAALRCALLGISIGLRRDLIPCRTGLVAMLCLDSSFVGSSIRSFHAALNLTAGPNC